METVTMQVPTTIGAAFAGGFYAGRIRVNDDLFALIVAPAAEGQSAGPWNGKLKAVAGAMSYFEGLANTDAMAAAGSKIAQWARALRIADYDDWYLPSRDELELLYRHFKPGTEENWTYRNGDNPSSVPAGYPYTSALPAQTSIEAFRAGGTEAFAEEWYWSSTQCEPDADSAWCQGFTNGTQSYDPKYGGLRARAVRRVPV